MSAPGLGVSRMSAMKRRISERRGVIGTYCSRPEGQTGTEAETWASWDEASVTYHSRLKPRLVDDKHKPAGFVEYEWIGQHPVFGCSSEHQSVLVLADKRTGKPLSLVAIVVDVPTQRSNPLRNRSRVLR